MMDSVKIGLTYFLIVFAAGFLLGVIRVVAMVPRFGVREAEPLELPLMIVVTVFAARWVVRHFRIPAGPHLRLAVIQFQGLPIS